MTWRERTVIDMLTTAHLTRTIAATALIATLATTSVAVARPDSPLRPTTSPSGAHAVPQWSVPRTEGLGVKPLQRDAAVIPTSPAAATSRVDAGTAAAAAVPLTRDDDASSTDWLPFAAGAGLLGLLAALAVAVRRRGRPLAHPFRTPRV